MQRALSARWPPIAVFALAFLVRAVYLFQARDHPLAGFVHALIDSLYYHRHAQEVAGGDFLHISPFFLGPLYPYLMAGLYALLHPSMEVVYWAQALMGAASCLLLFLIADRVFDRRVALLSGVLLAFHPLHLYYTSMVLPAVLALFVNLLLLHVLLRAFDAPTIRGAALVGVVLGLAILAKSNALVLLPLFAGMWLWLQDQQTPRQRRLWCVVLTAATFATLAPATLHNWMVSERFVLVTTSGGRNLWKGNGAIANGTHPLGHSDRSEAGLGRRLAGSVDPVRAAEESGEYVSRTLAHVRENPGDTAQLLLKKLVLFWNAVELGVRDQFYFAREHASLLRVPIAFGWLAPLGLVGALWAYRPRSRVLFVHALLAAQVFSFVTIFVLARYRLVAVACLIVFASWLAWTWLDAAREGRWRVIAAPLCAAAALAVFVNWPLAEFPKQRGYALVYEKIGDKHVQANQPEAAIAAYRRARELDWQGQNPNAKRGAMLVEIARVQRKQGERAQAIATLRQALEETTVDDLKSARVHLQAQELLTQLERGS